MRTNRMAVLFLPISAFSKSAFAGFGSMANIEPDDYYSGSSGGIFFAILLVAFTTLALYHHFKTENNNTDEIPDEVNGWSWGAFLLTFFWAIGNRTWIGLISAVPYFFSIAIFGSNRAWSFPIAAVSWFFSVAVSVVFGVYGKKWAWRNKKWDSLEHFNRVQRKWSVWGVTIAAAITTLGAVAAIAILFTLDGQPISPKATKSTSAAAFDPSTARLADSQNQPAASAPSLPAPPQQEQAPQAATMQPTFPSPAVVSEFAPCSGPNCGYVPSVEKVAAIPVPVRNDIQAVSLYEGFPFAPSGTGTARKSPQLPETHPVSFLAITRGDPGAGDVKPIFPAPLIQD